MPHRFLSPEAVSKIDAMQEFISRARALEAELQSFEIGPPAPDDNPAEETDTPPRLPPIRWAKGKRGNVTQWTCSWQKQRLRVERHKTKSQGVYFEGYIGEDYIGRSKSTVQCRAKVETAAVERAS